WPARMSPDSASTTTHVLVAKSGICTPSAAEGVGDGVAGVSSAATGAAARRTAAAVAIKIRITDQRKHAFSAFRATPRRRSPSLADPGASLPRRGIVLASGEAVG